MPRPVCIPCACEMHNSGVGELVEFTRKQGREQRDYQVFAADVYKCPSCGTTVAARYGSHPLWEHFNSQSKPEPILVTVREL